MARRRRCGRACAAPDAARFEREVQQRGVRRFRVLGLNMFAAVMLLLAGLWLTFVPREDLLHIFKVNWIDIMVLPVLVRMQGRELVLQPSKSTQPAKREKAA